MKRWQEKHLNFQHIAKIQPEFKDAVGLYDSKTETVYVDTALPIYCAGTVRSILEHERVHARIDLAGLTMSKLKEERLCSLLSMAVTPDQYLTHIEAALKFCLYSTYSWSRKKDRPMIIEAACNLADVDYIPAMRSLAED